MRPATHAERPAARAGEDCPGCKKAEWLAKADEIIARKSAERSGSGPVPDSAAAPDGAMHMTKEEFQEQLKSSLDGVDDMPPLDGDPTACSPPSCVFKPTAVCGRGTHG